MSNKDLDSYFQSALDKNNSAYEDHDRMESYLSPTFVFARHLKAHPSLRALSAEAVAQEVDNWFKRMGYSNVEQGWTEGFPADDLDSRVRGSDACKP